MWLQECRRRFADTTEQFTPSRQDLDAIERQLVRAQTTLEVAPSDLHLIEETDAWNYAAWWPRLSGTVRDTIILPRNLSASATARERAVKELYGRLKHIEVVSVVLRFVCPHAFGIISPPVMWLIGLTSSNDHVETYRQYTEALRKLAEHYEFGKVADVDMALWAAAHLSTDFRSPEIADQMKADAFFQEVRLANIADALRIEPRTANRLVLAKALVKHEHVAAAVIGAHVFEELLRRIPGLNPFKLGVGEVRKLELPPNLSAIRDEILEAYPLRNRAVHPDPDPIDRPDAKRFIQLVDKLHTELGKRRKQARRQT